MAGALIAAAAPSISIVVSPSDSSVLGTVVGTAYAGVQFRNDGTEFSTPASGSSAFTNSLGDWLDKGDASEVWIQWTRTGGTLGDWNDLDDGDARLQLSTTRNWRIVRSGPGTNTIIGYFEFWDAASGGTLLHTTASRTFTADNVI